MQEFFKETTFIKQFVNFCSSWIVIIDGLLNDDNFMK